jgi:hypothetical protein
MHTRAYGSIHTALSTYIVIHHRIIIETHMPKYLDSIMFTIFIYTHLQLIQGMLLAMGTITVDIFPPPIGY